MLMMSTLVWILILAGKVVIGMIIKEDGGDGLPINVVDYYMGSRTLWCNQFQDKRMW